MKSVWSHINPSLKKVLKKQRATLQQLNYHLPDGYQDRVHCHINGGFLKIYAINSAWASKLRYQQHEILKSIQADPALNVQKIQVFVATDHSAKDESKTHSLGLKSGSADSVMKIAEGCSDEELKAAFESLANKAASKPNAKS